MEVWEVFFWENGASRKIGEVIFAYGKTPFKTDKLFEPPIVVLAPKKGGK